MDIKKGKAKKKNPKQKEPPSLFFIISSYRIDNILSSFDDEVFTKMRYKIIHFFCTRKLM